MKRQGSKALDELEDQFHRMVGFCITEWALVDENIFLIFQQCVGPPKQCAIIYYRSPGLDIRLSLTDEIVRSVLPEPKRKSGGHKHPLVKEWTSILSDIRELLSTRRRIAHQPVQTHQVRFSGAIINGAPLNTAPLNSPARTESWLAIYAGQHERLREREAGHKALTVNDLTAHFLAVNKLVPRTYEFYLSLAGKLAEE